MSRPGVFRSIPVALPLGLTCSALVLTLLAGCGTSADTARQVLREQAQEQALARAQSEEETRKRVSRPEVELALIRKAQEDGRYFASLAYLEAYRQQYGDTPESAALRAEAQRRTGQDEASAQTYRALLDGPQAAVAWHGLGLLAGARGDYAQAADDLGKAVRMRPVDAEYLGDWGYALLRSGNTKASRVPLGQAAELAPDNQRILGNLAMLLLVEGNAASAEQVMARSHLSAQARKQVLQLAEQTRAGTAAVPAGPVAVAPAVSAVPAQSGVMSMTPQHRSLMGRYATDDPPTP